MKRLLCTTDVENRRERRSSSRLPRRPPATAGKLGADATLAASPRWVFLFFGILALLGGCDGTFPDLILGDEVVVRLLNNTDYDVDIVVYYDDDPDISESNLIDDGTKLEFTLEPDETTSFRRGCDRLQAVIVDPATLRVLGGLGPTTRSEVLRDGDDFGCRDTVVFTFEGSLLDFDVSWDAP